MRQEYLHPWSLKFKEKSQEKKYCALRENMFRSNMVCVYIVWIFIVFCQSVVAGSCTTLIICLCACTFVLTAGSVLIMAEEFQGDTYVIFLL